MSKIGVFGGTFNPIHEGHINFLRQVRSQLKLDKISLVVCRNALHKNVKLASQQDRIEMCKLATCDLPYVEVSDLEFEIDKNGYSLHTLQQIKNRNEGSEIFLIVGPDSFLKIGTWHKFRSILNLATVVSGYSNENEQKEMEKLALNLEFSPVLLNVNLEPVHSTKIRIKMAQGLSVSSSLNADVHAHILKNKLYCEQGALVVECENACRNMVSRSRFMHCVAVSKMAVQLARVYGENAYNARIAGLLHDIVKEQKPAFLLKILKMDSSCKLSEVEKVSYKLWHAPAGAIYCDRVLGLEIKPVLSAIACHTAGKANMTTFEKIIYISDNISLDRKSSNAKIGRKMAFKNLDKTLLFHLKNHLQVCFKKNLVLLDDSIRCYNQLITTRNEQKNFY